MTEKMKKLRNIFLFLFEDILFSEVIVALLLCFFFLCFSTDKLYMVCLGLLILLILSLLKLPLIFASVSKNKIYEYIKENKFILILFIIFDFCLLCTLFWFKGAYFIYLSLTIPSLLIYAIVRKIKKIELIYKCGLKLLTFLLVLLLCFYPLSSKISSFLDLYVYSHMYYILFFFIFIIITFVENILSALLYLYFNLLDLEAIKKMFFKEKLKRIILILFEATVFFILVVPICSD